MSNRLRRELATKFRKQIEANTPPDGFPDLRLPEDIILLEMLQTAVAELGSTGEIEPFSDSTRTLIGREVSRLQGELDNLPSGDPKRLDIEAAMDGFLLLTSTY